MTGSVILTDPVSSCLYLAAVVGQEQKPTLQKPPGPDSVLHWLLFSAENLRGSVRGWILSTEQCERAKADLLASLHDLNNFLCTRTYLVGERMSLADIGVAMTIVPAFAQVLDQAFRSSHRHLTRWFNTIVHHELVVQVVGIVKLCQKEVEVKLGACKDKENKATEPVKNKITVKKTDLNLDIMYEKVSEDSKKTNIPEAVEKEVFTTKLSTHVYIEKKCEDKGVCMAIPQLDGDTGEVEDSDELLIECKEILTKLLNNDYDKFEILALAVKFDVNINDDASFSKQMYLLQLKVLENILKEDESEYYRRIYEETLLQTHIEKPTGYRCCLIGCLFRADRHRNYIHHLSQIHPNHNKFACKFLNKCRREFSSIQILLDHVKRDHSKVTQSETFAQLPSVAFACKCSLLSCGGKQFDNLSQLLTHMNVFHSKDYRSCIFSGCSKQFNPFAVSRHHFREIHIKNKKIELKEENMVQSATPSAPSNLTAQNPGTVEIADIDDNVGEEYDVDDIEFLESGSGLGTTEEQGNYFLMAYADFLNRMCHAKYVPHSTMQIIATEFFNHCLKSQEIRKVKLEESLKNNSNLNDNEITEIVQNVLYEDDLIKAMKEVNSNYKQDKFIRENFRYIAPLEIVLNKTDADKGAVKDCFHYIPVCESVKALLEDPTVITVLDNAKGNDSKEAGVLRDVKDGNVFKNVKFFQDNPGAFAAMFYSDAVELVNPLGAARGKHKVIQIFFNLAEIPKCQRSQVDRMQVALIVKEKLVKKYGIHKIYKNLVDDLKKLENGIEVENPVPRIIKCGVLLHSGDNLESHSVGGFSMSFSSRDVCRFCHIQHEELSNNIHGLDGETQLRGWTVAEYDEICDSIESTLDEQVFEIEDTIIDTPVLDFEDHLFDEFDEPEDFDSPVSGEGLEEEEDEERKEMYGLRHRCPFNSLQAFHAVYSFPPDILHDLMEGDMI